MKGSGVREYAIVSIDSHLEAHPDLWRSYVDSDFRRHVPVLVPMASYKASQYENTGPWGTVTSAASLPGGGYGLRSPSGEVNDYGLVFFDPAGDYEGRWKSAVVHGLNYGPGVLGAGDGEQRVREMDEDGVDAEVLYLGSAINSAQKSAASESPEALLAVIRGYNDWLSAEYTAADPDRLWGLALLPPGVDDAIDEMRRVAGKPGIRGVVSWPATEPDDDRFWSAALEVGMPLTAHVAGAAPKVAWPPKEHAEEFARYSIAVQAMRIIISGVFDRLPELRLCFAETHVGWLPYAMQHLDANYRKHGLWADIELAHDPSWYFKRHFAWGFMTDSVGISLRHHVGVENIMWSSDFPHMNTDWPDSRRVIERVFAGVPAEETRKMTRDNALDFFHISGGP
jgi:predicted TIM-barrel fold metal-dependent hydrolase